MMSAAEYVVIGDSSRIMPLWLVSLEPTLLVHPVKIKTESAIASAITACPDLECFFTLKPYICANSYYILA
jgi:hypothetical protein